MVRILLLATRTQSIDTMKKLMPPGVQLRTGMLSSGSTIAFDSAFNPDVIIVHIENVNRQRLFGIMDIREDDAYKYLPLLVVGDPDDQEIFDQNVKPGADRRVDPADGESAVKNAIIGVIGLRNMEDKHVLVVDDDPVVLRMVRSYLEDSYVVTAVKSGKLALKFLEKQRPDAILLDYMMPEWDGPTTLQLIRSKESNRRIPVIFMTAVTEKNKIMEVLALKPQGYLLKPVTKTDLLAKLRDFI